MGGVRLKTSKVLRLKTKAATKIVVRNVSGKKLFEMDLRGMGITVTVSLTISIEVELEDEVAR
jgi:hypothetical protein